MTREQIQDGIRQFENNPCPAGYYERNGGGLFIYVREPDDATIDGHTAVNACPQFDPDSPVFADCRTMGDVAHKCRVLWSDALDAIIGPVK